jgi:hypothetical protein
VKGELELIAHADCEHTERARWAARLAPTACALITANSDGTSAGHATDELLDDTGWLMLQGLALVAFAVSVVALISLYAGR